MLVDHKAVGYMEGHPPSREALGGSGVMKPVVWASICNLLVIPVAAGVLCVAYNISLRPEVSALLMSVSSIIVATNAVLLNRAEKELVII